MKARLFAMHCNTQYTHNTHASYNNNNQWINQTIHAQHPNPINSPNRRSIKRRGGQPFTSGPLRRAPPTTCARSPKSYNTNHIPTHTQTQPQQYASVIIFITKICKL